MLATNGNSYGRQGRRDEKNGKGETSKSRKENVDLKP